jgi:hypothetical protein
LPLARSRYRPLLDDETIRLYKAGEHDLSEHR